MPKSYTATTLILNKTTRTGSSHTYFQGSLHEIYIKKQNNVVNNKSPETGQVSK